MVRFKGSEQPRPDRRSVVQPLFPDSGALRLGGFSQRRVRVLGAELFPPQLLPIEQRRQLDMIRLPTTAIQALALADKLKTDGAGTDLQPRTRDGLQQLEWI